MQNKLKIAILGYGKMGKEIEKLAPESSCEVVAIIDNEHDWEKNLDLLQNADVAIDFSHPDAVVHNIYKCFDLHLPIVVGTTAWETHREHIEKYCVNNQESLFYASNFSIGVNLFFLFNRLLAQTMHSFDQYHVKIKEVHHTAKVDKPSGTALSLIQDILKNDSRYHSWDLCESSFAADILAVQADRKPGVVGKHEVIYESDEDSISIIHSAKNRKGFAKGALIAANWLVGKKGCYTMNDLLKLGAL